MRPVRPSTLEAPAYPEFDPANPVSFLFTLAHRILLYFAIVPALFLGRRRFGERFFTLDVAFVALTVVWAMVGTAGGCNALSTVDAVQQASYDYDRRGVAVQDRSSVPTEMLKAAVAGDDKPESKQTAREKAGRHALAFIVALGVGLLFTALVAFRYLGIVRRFVTDDFSVHSRSDGEPAKWWFKLPLPRTLQPYLIRCIGEPGLFFVAGGAVATWTGSTLLSFGVFCFTLGFVLQQSMLLNQARADILDKADAQLESDWSMQELELVKAGKEPELVEQRHIPPVVRAAINDRAKQAFAQLRASADAQGLATGDQSGLIPQRPAGT